MWSIPNVHSNFHTLAAWAMNWSHTWNSHTKLVQLSPQLKWFWNVWIAPLVAFVHLFCVLQILISLFRFFCFLLLLAYPAHPVLLCSLSISRSSNTLLNMTMTLNCWSVKCRRNCCHICTYQKYWIPSKGLVGSVPGASVHTVPLCLSASATQEKTLTTLQFCWFACQLQALAISTHPMDLMHIQFWAVRWLECLQFVLAWVWLLLFAENFVLCFVCTSLILLLLL